MPLLLISVAAWGEERNLVDLRSKVAHSPVVRAKIGVGVERRKPMPKLTWDRIDDIALALYDKFPDLDPTHVRFTDLHKWITELEDFGDDPMKSNESKLKAIQMAWLDEYNDNE